MSEPFQLQIGQALLIADNNKTPSDEYFSKIDEIVNNKIIIDNPFSERELTVKLGDVLTFFILQDNDVYSFKSKIEEINFGEKQAVIIEHPQNINHSRRRISIRFPVALTVKYEFKYDKLFSKNKLSTGTAVAQNISLGGIFLETKNKIHDKARDFKVHFTLPSYPSLHLECKIIRKHIEKNITKFVVTFINIKTQERENIMRFIFHTQQKTNMEKSILEKL